MSPWDALIAASKRAPVLAAAWAVLGVAAVVAIIGGWGISPQFAVFGTVIAIGLMAALTVLGYFVAVLGRAADAPDGPSRARLDREFSRAGRRVGEVLLWGFSLQVLVTATLLLTSFFFYWPRTIEPGKIDSIADCEEAEQQVLEASMYQNLANNESDKASGAAHELLARNAENHRALNVLASLAFYDRNFHEAARLFEKALAARPENDSIRGNLADTYVELRRYDDALQMYGGMTEKGSDWDYEVARAEIYKGKYEAGISRLAAVRTGANYGRARALEAAARAGLAVAGTDPDGNRRRAIELLRSAIASDPLLWRERLVAQTPQQSEGFDQTIDLLGELIPVAFSEDPT